MDAILLAQLIRNDITAFPPFSRRSSPLCPLSRFEYNACSLGKRGNYIKGVSRIRYAFYMNDKHNLYYLRDRRHTIIH